MVMTYDPQKHHRRSIRLKGWDYSRPGAYFVTVCTQNRECLFGEIQKDEMQLNGFGGIILERWNCIPNHFKHVQLDTFQVMPNHIHGILFILDVGAKHSEVQCHKIEGNKFGNASPLQKKPHGTQPGSLSAIIQNFLSVSTRNINRIRNTPGDRIWQRNYYDRIIRHDDELRKIREYIVNNPLKWELDKDNPQNW
jgi:REP element-mobilizing transposase RayT